MKTVQALHLRSTRYGADGGVLPAQAIRRMLAAGHVTAFEDIASAQVQPASLDLRLGARAYRVRASFLPGGRPVTEQVHKFALDELDLIGGAVLDVGCVYAAPLMERLDLPPDVSAVANAKSSTGRLDVFTRVIADGGAGFDQVPPGYTGPLWAIICPQTFPVRVRKGSTLAQVRFRRGPAFTGEAWPLTVDLAGDGVVGWRARRLTPAIDVDAESACATRDFWEPITASEGRLILDPERFYILASRESVAISPIHAAEMVPFDAKLGEFRAHYAGFFDPGFGWGAESRAVLEVRCHKAPFILEDGQAVGSLVFEGMVEQPDQLYGARIGSHYQAQGLKLSKHFW